MTIKSSLCRWPLSALFLLAALATEEPSFAQTRATNAPPKTVGSKVRFRPQSTGSPSVRLTGGSRGTGDKTVTLDVLAPDDVGLTTSEQPSLFWFQSQLSDAKFELAILEENKIKPLFQWTLDRAPGAGIQRLDLTQRGVRLAPGVEYQWVVALVNDPENRSRDLVASGAIKRVETTADLKSKLAQADASSRPAAFAEAGIWYDALTSLSDQIEAHPADRDLRETRADLLRQAGLKAAAAAETAAAQLAPVPPR